MKIQVKRLPSNVIYDYTDVFGNRCYHTSRSHYEVKVSKRFGQSFKSVYKVIDE